MDSIFLDTPKVFRCNGIQPTTQDHPCKLPDRVITQWTLSLFCRKAPCQPELAWTCYNYAEALRVKADGRAPLRDDHAKAISLQRSQPRRGRQLRHPGRSRRRPRHFRHSRITPLNTSLYRLQIFLLPWQPLIVLFTNCRASPRSCRRHVLRIWPKGISAITTESTRVSGGD